MSVLDEIDEQIEAVISEMWILNEHGVRPDPLSVMSSIYFLEQLLTKYKAEVMDTHEECIEGFEEDGDD